MYSDDAFLRPHPDNPRYFLYRGRPTVLITSTEHYGAVSNAAFDYVAYLDMLASYGFNLTRLSVTMREAESEFKGLAGWQNTLAPRRENYVGPWKRSDRPGCLDGGNKLDLDQWNGEFFARLRDFCAKAGARGIVVEVTIFNQYYNDKPDGPWSLCPLNPANNTSGEGATAYNRFTTCENPRLLARQEALVRKVAGELKEFGNIYYEVCNEPPYPQDEGAALPEDHPEILGEKAISAWQNHIAAVIRAEESAFPQKHIIAVGDPHAGIDAALFSVYNYHYRQWADNGARKHSSHGKALAFDETLTGIVSWNREMRFDERRMEAWEFFLRGFAVYDYLDFTIATDDPAGCGNADFPDGQRYDGTVLRQYLKHLKIFMERLDFVHMTPDDSVIRSISDTAKAWAMAGEGAVAVYICGSALKSVVLALPQGDWLAEWVSPVTGAVVRTQRDVAGGGDAALELPQYQTDIALRLTRQSAARL